MAVCSQPPVKTRQSQRTEPTPETGINAFIDTTKGTDTGSVSESVRTYRLKGEAGYNGKTLYAGTITRTIHWHFYYFQACTCGSVYIFLFFSSIIITSAILYVRARRKRRISRQKATWCTSVCSRHAKTVSEKIYKTSGGEMKAKIMQQPNCFFFLLRCGEWTNRFTTLFGGSGGWWRNQSSALVKGCRVKSCLPETF